MKVQNSRMHGSNTLIDKNIRNKKEKSIYNNNIIKQIEKLNNQCMASMRNNDEWHS